MSKMPQYRSSFVLVSPVCPCSFLLKNNHTFLKTLVSGDNAGQIIVVILFLTIYAVVVLAQCTKAVLPLKIYLLPAKTSHKL